MKIKCPECVLLGGLLVILLAVVAVFSLLPAQQGIVDYGGFVAHLKKLNVTVVEGGLAEKDDMLRGEKHKLYINDEYVQVWEYRSENSALRDKENIGPDGSEIKMGFGSVAIVDWVAPPHFYQKGRIIVLYNGENKEILTALEAVLGQQFAGS